jgi:hypothetical protein
MSKRADAVNAWHTGDGTITIALRVDGDWQETRLSVKDADQLQGMFYLLVKNDEVAPG